MIWSWHESRGCFVVCYADGAGVGSIAVGDVDGIGAVDVSAVDSVGDFYSFGYVDNICGVSVGGGGGVDVNEGGNDEATCPPGVTYGNPKHSPTTQQTYAM